MYTNARFLLAALVLSLPAVALAETSPVVSSAFDFGAHAAAAAPRWRRYAVGKRPEEAPLSIARKRSHSRAVSAGRFIARHLRAGGSVRTSMNGQWSTQRPGEEPISRSGQLSMDNNSLSTRMLRLRFRW